MNLSVEDVWMLRLVNQATAQGFVVAQDYHTREVMLFASSGEVLVSDGVSVIRHWLRHFANCRRYGRRCCIDGRSTCRCVPEFPGVRVLASVFVAH